MNTLARFSILFLALLLVTADVADAQGILGRARRAVQRGAERAVEREAERRADRAITGAIECVLGDRACAEEAQANGQPVVYTDGEGNPVDEGGNPVDPSTAASSAANPGEGAWANYDFVPGDRVLYAEDYESTYTGNVPDRIDFNEGVMEVVRLQGGGQALRFADAGSFAIPLPETLPAQFTIEFDVFSGDDWNSVVLGTGPLDDPNDGYHCFHGDLRNHSAAEFRIGDFFETGVYSENGGTSKARSEDHMNGFVPVRIAVDDQYVKMYIGSRRVANVPNADVQRTNRLLVTACGELAAEDNGSAAPAFIDNLRIAAGGRTILYDDLMANGSVATRGILFDTGSARIRPESTPTLQDLSRTLQQHGDLRLRIEGHTDNTGNAATNQSLSEQRAQAVRAWLVDQGIDGSRLEAEGKGQTEPAADNGTPEGRQQNRRVVLVRL